MDGRTDGRTYGRRNETGQRDAARTRRGETRVDARRLRIRLSELFRAVRPTLARTSSMCLLMQDNADYSGCPRDSGSPPRRDTMTRKLGSCGRSGRGNPFVKSADLISGSPLLAPDTFGCSFDGTFEFTDPAARYASRPFFLSSRVSRHQRATARLERGNSVACLRSFGLDASVGPFSRRSASYSANRKWPHAWDNTTGVSF